MSGLVKKRNGNENQAVGAGGSCFLVYIPGHKLSAVLKTWC